MTMHSAYTTKGISLIETLVASGVFVILVSTLGIMGFSGLELSRTGGERMDAIALAEEGIEAVREMGRQDISTLRDGVYGLATSTAGYVLTDTPDHMLGFVRTISIEHVSSGRNRVTVRITKEGEMETPITELTTFVHSLNSFSFTHTNASDFLSGGDNSTRVRSDIGDGAVGLGFLGNFSAPKILASADLLSAATVSAFAESGGILLSGSNINGEELALFDIGDISSGNMPKLRSVNIGANVTAISIMGDYAYVGTEGDDRELVVVRIHDGIVVRMIDLLGTANVGGVFATGTTLYVSRLTSTQPEIYKFSIASPEVGIPQLASLQFAGDVYGVSSDNAGHLFLATSANTGEVAVVNEGPFTLLATLDLPGTANARSLALLGAELYVTRLSSTDAEVVKIDISTPSASMPIVASAQVSGSVYGISLTPEDKIIVATSVTASDVIMFDRSLVQQGQYDVGTSAGARAVLVRGAYVYAGMLTSNPEVVVLRGNSGSWELPLIVGRSDTLGNNDAYSVWSDGVRAYLGTANQASGDEFYIFDITTPATPVLLGSLNVGGNVNAISIIDTKAYLATSQSSRELTVVNIANPASPTIIGGYNVVGAVPATSLVASSTTLYLGTRNNTASAGRELYAINVSTPTLPTLMAGFEVGANVNGVARNSDGRLFLATASDAKELMVLDTVGTSSIQERASYDTPNTGDGLSVAWTSDQGGFLVLGTQNNGVGGDYFIFNIASNGAPLLRSSIDLSGDNRGVSVHDSVGLVVNSRSGGSLTVLNVENPLSPLVMQQTPLGGVGYGVSQNASSAIVADGGNLTELIVVTPSDVSAILAKEGWFSSAVLDAGSPTAWQTLNWSVSGTGTVRMQLRTADSISDIAHARWVGSDGTFATTYNTSGQTIVTDPFASGTQYLQYRMLLLGDGLTSPVVEEVSLVYN